jgi:hypothetical protein
VVVPKWARLLVAAAATLEVHLARAGGDGGPEETECEVEELINTVFRTGRIACDLNGNGRVGVDDVVQGVREHLFVDDEEGATATPTPSPTPQEEPTSPVSTWKFVDVTRPAGLAYADPFSLRGVVAAGDFDNDGWTDLYVVRGETHRDRPNPLYRNRGDGTFEEVAAAVGLVPGFPGPGAVFADVDGDGWLDLFVNGCCGLGPRLYGNLAGQRFEDRTDLSGLLTSHAWISNHGAALGDYDRDGFLDLFTANYGALDLPGMPIRNLWRANGDGSFSDVTAHARVRGPTSICPGLSREPTASSWVFTPNFADVNNDGWPDLLVTADCGTSRVFLNQRDGTFADVTNSVISDEAGMGAAIGDYDNDGNLDWFITSIWYPPAAMGFHTGNRLYRGRGDGTFEDVTSRAGVREGYWGWAACFADFNNDGHLDIFHVNGTNDEGWFVDDPSRLYIANGDGTFTDRAAELGAQDTGVGQGVVCFDYDGDGDIDILIGNFAQPLRLYRNDGGNHGAFLAITLNGRTPNTQAIGARVSVKTGAVIQMRELRAGSNYVSQDPAVAHFGLGDALQVDEVRIIWPDQTATCLFDVASGRRIRIDQPPPGDQSSFPREGCSMEMTGSIAASGPTINGSGRATEPPRPPAIDKRSAKGGKVQRGERPSHVARPSRRQRERRGDEGRPRRTSRIVDASPPSRSLDEQTDLSSPGDRRWH